MKSKDIRKLAANPQFIPGASGEPGVNSAGA
jgi:hypothetical protein